MDQLNNHLEQAYVYEMNQRVKGYYLPTMGKGLIIATTNRSGINLLNFRLFKKDTASFPVDNQVAVKFLETLGYQPFKTAKRMFLGKKVDILFSKIFNRAGGNLG